MHKLTRKIFPGVPLAKEAAKKELPHACMHKKAPGLV
jgi:hypothetical protein